MGWRGCGGIVVVFGDERMGALGLIGGCFPEMMGNVQRSYRIIRSRGDDTLIVQEGEVALQTNDINGGLRIKELFLVYSYRKDRIIKASIYHGDEQCCKRSHSTTGPFLTSLPCGSPPRSLGLCGGSGGIFFGRILGNVAFLVFEFILFGIFLGFSCL